MTHPLCQRYQLRRQAIFKGALNTSMNQLTNKTHRKLTDDVVFECDEPDRPLVISFSFAHWGKPSTFDFFGRLQKFKNVFHEPFNCIYVQDPKSRWYHYGVEGLGENVDEVALSLKREIERLQPSHIVTVGQSMGAYAALVFGALLNVDKVIAFAPQAFIDCSLLESYNDNRYTESLREIQESTVSVKYLDVVSLYQQLICQPKVHILFGTKGGNSQNETVPNTA